LGDANPKSFHLKVNFRHEKNSSKSYIKCKADSLSGGKNGDGADPVFSNACHSRTKRPQF